MKIVSNEEIICKESLPQIIKKIFIVCKQDPNLQKTKELKEIECKIEELSKKEMRHDELIEKSKQMKEDLERKISILEDENENLRIKLLEELGCEV